MNVSRTALGRAFAVLSRAIVAAFVGGVLITGSAFAEDIRDEMPTYDDYKKMSPFMQGLYEDAIQEVLIGRAAELETRKLEVGMEFLPDSLVPAFLPVLGMWCEDANAARKKKRSPANGNSETAQECKRLDADKRGMLCGMWKLEAGKKCNAENVRALMVEKCKKDPDSDKSKCTAAEVSTCSGKTIPCNTDWICPKAAQNGGKPEPFCSPQDGMESKTCGDRYEEHHGVNMRGRKLSKAAEKRMMANAKTDDAKAKAKCTQELNRLVLAARGAVSARTPGQYWGSKAANIQGESADTLRANGQQAAGLEVKCQAVEKFITDNKDGKCKDVVAGLETKSSRGALRTYFGGSDFACNKLPKLSGDTCVSKTLSDTTKYNEAANEAAGFCTCVDASYCESLRGVIAYNNYLRGVGPQENLKDSSGTATEFREAQ